MKFQKLQITDLANKLLKSLYSIDDSNVEVEVTTSRNDENELERENLSFKEKLALKLQQNKTKSKIVQKVETSVLKKEMQLYEDSKNDGTRPHHLELLYIAMLNVTPTSVESERAFSSAGLFVTKIRSRLGDSTVNMLVFMRDYLKRH